MFIGDCMPLLYSVCVCEAKISIWNPVGIGRVQNDMQACLQSFLEAFGLFLVFSGQTKPNKTLHLSRTEQQQNISTLKYTFLIQSDLFIFVFLPFKQFIST